MKRLVLACVLAFGCANPSAPVPTDPVAPSATSAPPPAPAPSASPAASLPPPPDPPSAAEEPENVVPPVLAGAGKKSTAGPAGVVVSVDPEASRVGAKILEAGGNAVDAAVAVAFVLAVTHPSAGNLGGGGFLLVRPRGGPTSALDFRETAPAKLTRELFDRMIGADGSGALSVGVPGTVRGLELVHRKFGKRSWKDVVEPARRLAERGHRVRAREAATLSWSWKELAKNPAARAEFGKAGKPYREKDVIVRKDLALVLARIAERGASGFYEGETGAAIAKAVNAAGGVLDESDLRGYQAKFRQPLELSYRGLTVETMPPPSAGGVALQEILGILARSGGAERKAFSVEDAHLFLEASRRAQADRRFSVVDPDSIAPGELARKLARFRDTRALLARLPIDPERPTPSEKVHPLYAEVSRELEHTTHLSVVDADGMAVSLTTTLSAGFGAKLVVPGTGIVLNNSVASFASVGDNQPAPGRRTTSSMAPTLVTANGELRFVLGSPGGDTIPSTIAQVFHHLVDHGMPLDQSVEAGRLHQSFLPDEVRYERARPPPKATLDALRKMGHAISKKTIPMGDANSVVLVDGVPYGFADPREGGRAVAARASPRPAQP